MENKTFSRIYAAIFTIFAVAIIIGTLLFFKQISNAIDNEKESLTNELEILNISINDNLDKLSQSAFLISKSNSLLEFEIDSSRYSPEQAYQLLLAKNFEDVLQIQSFSIKMMNNFEVFFPKTQQTLGTSAPYKNLTDKKVILFRNWLYEKNQSGALLSYYTNNLNSKNLESTNKTDYIVRVSVDPNQLLAQNMRSSDGVALIINNSIYTNNLFNDANKFFYDKYANGNTDKNSFITFKHNKIYLMSRYQDDQTPLFTLASVKDITHIMPNIILSIIAFLTVISILTAVIFYALSVIRRKIHQPLREVTSGLLEFQQSNYDYRINSHAESEYQYIIKNFNLLGQKITTLIQDVIDEQDRTKSAELKQLQLQMNPHFLYNSLSFIASAAKLNMTDDVIEMCYSLSDYYRYILSKSNGDNTIKMEMDAILTYLHIFEMRSQRLNYQMAINSDLYDIKFPPMLLQPIVENSIKFGIETSEDNLEINIKGFIQQEELILQVEDNGKIITPKEITYINQVILQGDDQTHIGLINIKRRLHYNFGKTTSLKVSQNTPRGLVVTIKIPVASLV
ncbi:histidine kinase [Vagococcus sp. BWB3-3]|uniref:Histidine kinase n=1 Tax=Vagococcus allomyrinae TaxID=2794353 RepID=A0A940SSG3_9ENTE|nr:histidine kinase [Vagococcus allomyrinae]MBP1041907.1 histidine kinase [Vagococcus allomyrinae]